MKPRIYVFSIGESTTDLCMWALERYGFEPVLWKDKTKLWEKLARFYKEPGDVLYRIDADIVPNQDILKIAEYRFKKGDWWVHGMGFGWHQQRVIPISVHKVSRQAADIASKHIHEAQYALRPESQMWRLKEFHDPRRCRIADLFLGVHGYAQSSEDRERVRRMKEERKQSDNYDWKLADRLWLAGKNA